MGEGRRLADFSSSRASCKGVRLKTYCHHIYFCLPTILSALLRFGFDCWADETAVVVSREQLQLLWVGVPLATRSTTRHWIWKEKFTALLCYLAY